jgi:hypothetical protein
MYFIGKDMDQYVQQKEYVDTVIVPLVEVDLSTEGAKRSAGASEYLQSLTALLEKQFKGRILLLPPISYAKKADRQRIADELAEELKAADFKHVFYLTADASWRSIDSLENLLWLPAIPIEHMDQKFRNSVMEDQLRQVLPLFTKEWTKPS